MKLRFLSASPRSGKTENDSQKGPWSSKRFFLHFWIQTLKGNRPKNDPCENLENSVNEGWIPTNRLKHRIRYKTAAKIQKIACKTNPWITENTILVDSSQKGRILTAVLCTNVHSHCSFAHAIFDKCCKIPIKINKKSPKRPEGSKNGPDTENATKPQ